MKVCLIRPPKLKIKNSSPVVSFPPLGVALLAAVLRENNVSVKVIDGACEEIKDNKFEYQDNNLNYNFSRELITVGLSEEQTLERIDSDVDVIGVSCMFSIDWISDRKLINSIAERFPMAKLIVGGESVTGMYDIVLKQCPGVDACILGEGEDAILEYLETLSNKSDYKNVKGIAFCDSDGSVVVTEKRKRKRDINSIPFPAWDLFPLHNYPKPISKENYDGITLPLLATRGCPFRCTFCTSPDMWGTRYFMRSPESVVAEMEYCMVNYGVECFDFFDLTAIINKRWIFEFTDILKEKNLNVKWRFPAGTRSEAIDAKVAKALIDTGCDIIIYAPESGSKRMLELIQKKVDLPRMLDSMRQTKSQGLRIFINMIIGMPGEKHSDLFKTCLFLIQCAKLGVNDIGLAKFRPYPGSQMFYDLVKENKVDLEKDDYFIESLFLVDSVLLYKVFNHHIKSRALYIFYYFLILATFYGAQIIFKPKNFLHVFKFGSMYRYKTNLIQDIKSLNFSFN